MDEIMPAMGYLGE